MQCYIGYLVASLTKQAGSDNFKAKIGAKVFGQPTTDRKNYGIKNETYYDVDDLSVARTYLCTIEPWFAKLLETGLVFTVFEKTVWSGLSG
jgi:hypothetical protein